MRAFTLNKLNFGIRIGRKTVNGDNGGQTEYVFYVQNMPHKIGQTFFQSIEVFPAKLCFGKPAVYFKSANGCYYHNGRGYKSRHTAFNVKEFFSTEVRAESRLGHHIIACFQSHFCRYDRIAAVCDIGKRAAVHKRRRMLERLDQIRLHRIL